MGVYDTTSDGTEPPGEPGSIYYFHGDHLGSSNLVTNDEGEVYEHLEYFADGDLWIEQKVREVDGGYRFSGKFFDEETGFYDFGQRFYDPKTSLWLGIDPALIEAPGNFVGYPAVMAVYSYASHSPMRFIDPDGRCVLGLPCPSVSDIASSVSGAAKGAYGKAKELTDAARKHPVQTVVVGVGSVAACAAGGCAVVAGIGMVGAVVGMADSAAQYRDGEISASELVGRLAVDALLLGISKGLSNSSAPQLVPGEVVASVGAVSQTAGVVAGVTAAAEMYVLSQKLKPVNGRINVGGGLEPNSDKGTNLNALIPGTGGPNSGIPNHVKGDAKDIAAYFEAGSASEIVSSRLTANTVDWTSFAQGAYVVLKSGGKITMNIWDFGGYYVGQAVDALKAAGFTEVGSYGTGAATIIEATKPYNIYLMRERE
jgi:RHS repeat-associated protein